MTYRGPARTTTRRTPRTLAAAIAIAIVALISAGCSHAPAKTGAGSSSGNGVAATVEQAVKFSQCMRANGVSGFPDPDASGQLTIDGVVNGSSLNPNSPAFQQALNACKGLEPAGFMGSERTAQQQAAALKFAQCMRANGVLNFPDPTPNGPIINVQHAQSIPGFQAAVSKCRALLAAATGGQ